jgi:hypothetical protein
VTPTPQLTPEIDLIALNSQNTILGKAFGGEWYIRTYQPDLFNPTSVYVHDVKYSHQSDAVDYLLGIQPQSWLGQNRGNFLGFTTIQRWGFTPLASTGNYLSLLQRLQANQVARDINGKTTPGTIVKLLKPNSSEVIAQTVTTGTGDYHFENIPSLPGRVTQYQVAFYNLDNLEPREVKTIKLTTMSNQLPIGASALLISGGVTQEIALDQGFLGKIDDLQTEIGYRYGLTEDLTMGINLGYNDSIRAIGELLYQPTNLPVQITLAMLNSPDIDGFYLTSNLKLQPASNLIVDFNSDRLTRNIALNWQALPHLNLTLRGNNQQTNWSSSFRLAYEKEFLTTIATLQLNQEQDVSWSLTSRLGHFQFNYGDSPTHQQTELSYNLFQQSNVGHGYWLFINYEAYEFLETQNNLTTIGWRYRSTPELDSGGFWEVSCGYGVGTLGSGVILTLSRELVPGLRLQLDYKTVSTLANDGAFALKIVPNFDIFSNSRQWEF